MDANCQMILITDKEVSLTVIFQFVSMEFNIEITHNCHIFYDIWVLEIMVYSPKISNLYT